MRKRQRNVDVSGQPEPQPLAQPVTDDAFINDHDAVDSGGDDDDDDEKPKTAKTGRRKIKIEFIQDKSRRHITFSKRKAGIMKKAYELSTLTGTQVLLLVVSETGLVYTFTTAKLQPLVTQPEGKNLIQACLNAPHGSLPSSMPVGTPIGRSSNPMSMSSGPPPQNIPGGLSIGQNAGKDEDDGGDEDDQDRKRRRRNNIGNGTTSSNSRSGPGGGSPPSANSTIPPPLSIPPANSGPPSAQQTHPSSVQSAAQIGLNSSPSQGHAQVPSGTSQSQYSGSYGGHNHQQQGDGSMYAPSHMMPPGNYAFGAPGPGGQQQQLGGLAAAAASHSHWGAPQQQQQQQVSQGYRR